MPLFHLMSDTPVKKIPYEKDFEHWRVRMEPWEFQNIMDEFNRIIDERLATHVDQIHTAGWIPGSDWNGTVWSPIYYKATSEDHVRSAQAFGLFCFYAFMRRPEEWTYGKFNLAADGREIGSNTYFLRRR